MSTKLHASIFNRMFYKTLTLLGLFIIAASGCAQREPDCQTTILLEGFQDADQGINNARDVVASEKIIRRIATKYKPAFEQEELDKIVAQLQTELSATVDKNEPWIVKLNVSTKPRAFGTALLHGWIIVLNEEANADKERLKKMLKASKTEIDMLEKKLKELKSKSLKMMAEELQHRLSGADVKDRPLPKKVVEIREKMKQLEAEIQQKRIKILETQPTELVPQQRKKVSVLKKIKVNDLSKEDIADYQARKKRCPNLPKINFSQQIK